MSSLAAGGCHIHADLASLQGLVIERVARLGGRICVRFRVWGLGFGV